MKQTILYLFSVLALAMAGTTQAGTVTIPNMFTAGTPAKAADVNANFDAVKTATNDNDSRISKLEADNATLKADNTTLKDTVSQMQADIKALQSKLAAVNNSQVMALGPYLTVDTISDSRGPLVKLTGVNVQIVNGAGLTASANGLGNLIIGYDESDTSITPRCTIGWDETQGKPVTDQASCGAVNGIWTAAGFKTGSHYLVVGYGNNYSRWGGIVSGQFNTSNYDYASVLAGEQNTASGIGSIVSGGYQNFVFNGYSSVSGGNKNTALGLYSSVSGGYSNGSTGEWSSVSGGSFNNASGTQGSISGGQSNTSSGNMSSVLGGYSNTASGDLSSISGGSSNTAANQYSSVLGGSSQSSSADYQTIPALP